MKITLVGSRYFGATAFAAIRNEDVTVLRVVVPAADDRLALAANAAGVEVATQDWCFGKKGETARELWERALAPMGIRLLAEVLRYAKVHGQVPAKPQDEQFATRAPMIREPA